MKQKMADGEIKLTERPIAFQVDDEVVVIGECVDTILEGLAAYVAAVEPTITDNTDNFTKATVRACKEAKTVDGEDGPEIRVQSRTFNYYLNALGHQKIQCVLTD